MAKRRFYRSIPKLSKRNKFVLSTSVATISLLVAFLIGPRYGYFTVSIVAVLAALLTLFSLSPDVSQKKQWPIILLPGSIFTIAVGLFYFVLPERWVTRIIMLFLFAFGFYATLLVQNIYAISVARTIKLLQAARTIGFLLSVTSAFGLYYILYSLHAPLPIIILGTAIISFLLITPVIWSVSLKAFLGKHEFWHTCILTLVLTEIGTFITFWPISVAFSAIFLTGNYYTLVGVSQHWLENRLFKRVLLEFLWVSVILFIILYFTAKWGG